MAPINTRRLKYWPPRQTCLLCADPSTTAICKGCQDYLSTPLHCCQQCGIPLDEPAPRCGECLTTPPAFDESYAPYLYRRPLDKLINNFKHQHQLITGKGLSQLFCCAIRDHYSAEKRPLPQWILPVPLHWRRQWQRGFNQAAFLCTELNQTLGIKIIKGASKTLYTPSQEGLSRKQRLKNLRNSFNFRQTLSGESIAIVDDVMTTGATANSLARVLKKAGAGKVSVWTIARTPRAC